MPSRIPRAKWLKNLSEDERQAFSDWFESDWEAMRVMSKMGMDSPEAEAYGDPEPLRMIETALDRSEPYDGPVWRALANCSTEEMETFNALESGDPVMLDSIQSGTKKRAFPRRWLEWQDSPAERSVVLSVESNLSAVDVAALSPYPDQSEAIMRKGSRYTVVSTERRKDALYVNLREQVA